MCGFSDSQILTLFLLTHPNGRWTCRKMQHAVDSDYLGQCSQEFQQQRQLSRGRLFGCRALTDHLNFCLPTSVGVCVKQFFQYSILIS